MYSAEHGVGVSNQIEGSRQACYLPPERLKPLLERVAERLVCLCCPVAQPPLPPLRQLGVHEVGGQGVPPIIHP